jgi:N-methylhydantoinase B
VEYVSEVDGDLIHSFRSEALNYGSGFGINGGKDGGLAQNSVESDGKLMTDAPVYGLRNLRNARFTVSAAGGGGWGDPRRRDPALVARDVKDGIISVEHARKQYGVAFDAQGALDSAATTILRAAAAE